MSAHCFDHFFLLFASPSSSDMWKHVQWHAMAKIRYATLPLFQNNEFTFLGIMLRFSQ